MATLAELATLINDGSPFADKVRAATLKTAVAVAFESDQTANHANRLKVSKQFLVDPTGQQPRVLRYVIAAMASEELAAITGASDATIQGHVDASLAILADGS